MANQSITSILADYTKDSVDAINSAIKSASNNNVTAYRALQDYKKTAPFQKQETAKEALERVKAEEDLAEFQKQTIEANREGLSRKDYVARNDEQKEYVERLRKENRELSQTIDKEARTEAATIRTEERKAAREAEAALNEQAEESENITERVRDYRDSGLYLTKNIAENKFPSQTLVLKKPSDIVIYDDERNQPDIQNTFATFTVQDFLGFMKNKDFGHPESGIKKIITDDKIIFQTIPLDGGFIGPTTEVFGPYAQTRIEINKDNYIGNVKKSDLQNLLFHYLKSVQGSRLRVPYNIQLDEGNFETNEGIDGDMLNEIMNLEGRGN
jgi:hypothetical protein